MLPEILWGISKMCLRWFSIASFWNFCKTISNYFYAKLNCIFLKFFYDHSKKSLSWNSIASCQKYCQTLPNLSQSKLNCVLFEVFYDVLHMCPSRNSVASYWNFFQTFSICVLAENQLHCTEILLRHFKTVSRQKFNCIVPEFL